jgi:SH3 domain-containing YSC84-like protein 1
MKKTVVHALTGLILLAATPARSDDKSKDQDRLKNCGTVVTEILDIPDDVPRDLLDKADCVVISPSVLKAAFLLGAAMAGGR